MIFAVSRGPFSKGWFKYPFLSKSIKVVAEYSPGLSSKVILSFGCNVNTSMIAKFLSFMITERLFSLALTNSIGASSLGEINNFMGLLVES